MKLEVGMYVRNDYFGIGKIDKDYFDSNNKHWFNVQFNCYGDDDCHCGICEQSIGYKASHNIIDLIEVEDYVNGYLVLFAGATTWDNDGNVLDKQVHINHNGYDLWLREEYIKSIVTKEQFERVKYSLEV